ETREEDPSVTQVVQVAAHADGRDVSLVVHAPHTAVPDDAGVHLIGVESRRSLDALLPQHHVVSAGARGELAVVGIAWPGRGEDIALDLLHGGDVALPPPPH